MPDFELDLRNVVSEEVDGVTVIKSADLTAVSLVGVPLAPIPGLTQVVKRAADAEQDRVRKAITGEEPDRG